MATVGFSPAANVHYFGFAKQAAKGSGVVPADWAAYVEAVELAHNSSMRSVREGGSALYVSRDVIDAKLPGFRFAAPVRPSLYGKLMAYFLGAAAISGIADPYTHTLTPGTGTIWVSFERNINDEEIERIVDGFLTELVLNITKRDSGPEAVLSVVGGGLSAARIAAATAESYETNRPVLRSDATWTIDDNTPTNVESATVTMRWNFDEGILADSIVRHDAIKLTFEAQVETVQLFATAQEVIDWRETHYRSGSQDGSGTAYSETVYNSEDEGYTTGFAVAFSYQTAARQATLTIPNIGWADAKLTEPDPNASEAARLTRIGHLVKPAAGEAITATALNADAAAYIT